MIVFIIAGIVFIALVAVAVGVFDATQGTVRRVQAAERRARWEERVLQRHGGREPAEAGEPDWDDD